MRINWQQAVSFLIGAAIVLIIAFALGVFPTDLNYCYENQAGHKECATYNIALVAFWQIGKGLNWISPALTALATIFIAYFTLILKRSTDKLWIADERQLAHLEATAQRELRAYISVEHGMSFRQRGNIRFEFRPVIVNNGRTPASNVRILCKSEFRSTSLPPQILISKLVRLDCRPEA